MLRAIIIMKDRTVRLINLNAKKGDFIFGGGLYGIINSLIYSFNNPKDKNMIMGSELIYFENNPTPLNNEHLKEENKRINYDTKYFDENVLINYISQLQDISIGKGGLFDSLSWFTDKPERIVFIILGGIVLYSLITSGFKV